MVKPWDEDIIKGIKITKFRIKHHEIHGCGDNTMRDKAILKKQERHKQLRDESAKIGGAHVFK